MKEERRGGGGEGGREGERRTVARAGEGSSSLQPRSRPRHWTTHIHLPPHLVSQTTQQATSSRQTKTLTFAALSPPSHSTQRRHRAAARLLIQHRPPVQWRSPRSSGPSAKSRSSSRSTCRTRRVEFVTSDDGVRFFIVKVPLRRTSARARPRTGQVRPSSSRMRRRGCRANLPRRPRAHASRRRRSAAARCPPSRKTRSRRRRRGRRRRSPYRADRDCF